MTSWPSASTKILSAKSCAKQLRKLAKGNTPMGVIGLKLGRTPAAVRGKAGDKRISLKPVNRSPYNRRKG
jgi:hypothetical protein